MAAVVGHIRQYFGAFEHVFHEPASPDIHADICVVTPSALCCWWPPVIHMGSWCRPSWRRTGILGSILWSSASHRTRRGCGPCSVGLPGGCPDGCLLLSGPSAYRRPGDDRHGGRTEEGTNQLAWQADEDTILRWVDTEGYPVDGAIGPEGQYSKADIPEHTQYDTQSLAKFAFSIFWRAIRFAEEQQVPILLDY